MYRLSVEQHVVRDRAYVAHGIALYIRDSRAYGHVAVVAQEPEAMLSELKRAWKSLGYEMQHELDRTANGEMKARLEDGLAYMSGCSFTSKPPIEESYEKVQVATIEQFLEWPPQCEMMFVACTAAREQLHKATAWMPPSAAVIIYEIEGEEV